MDLRHRRKDIYIYYSPGPLVFSFEHSFPEPFSHPHLNTMPYIHSQQFEVAPRTSGSGISIIKHRRHSKSHRCRFIMDLGTELLTIHRQRRRRKSLHIFMTKSSRIPRCQIPKQNRWKTRVRLRIQPAQGGKLIAIGRVQSFHQHVLCRSGL